MLSCPRLGLASLHTLCVLVILIVSLCSRVGSGGTLSVAPVSGFARARGALRLRSRTP